MSPCRAPRGHLLSSVDDDLEPVVAHADRDVAARDARQVEPRGELAVDERVQGQAGRVVVIGHVERHAAATHGAAEATRVVVVVLEAAAAAVPRRPAAPQRAASLASSRRSVILAAHQFHLYTLQ